MIRIILIFFIFIIDAVNVNAKISIGAFYFDGWAGLSSKTIGIKNPPTHLTSLMIRDFKNLQPIWGWRDDDVTIMEKQIDFASKNGIDFFIFCWYWSDDNSKFNEKKVEANPLNTSLQLFLKARNRSKMKFAIVLANHQGFRIKGKENWETLIEYLSKKYFHNSQYLKVNDSPLLAVFSPDSASSYISDMKNVAIKHNSNGLYLVSCYSKPKGFDMMTWYNIRLPEHGYSEEHSYRELINYTENGWHKISKNINIAPVVMAGWDTRPWWNSYCKPGVYCINRTPLLFKKHVKNALDFISKRSQQDKIIFIYAWNELGEGGYLVPTKGDPKGRYLRCIKEAKSESIRKSFNN